MTLAVSYKAEITDDILPFVSKPSRYIAAEWNSVVKDPASAEVRVALAFPDVYEIGMSHLGLKILYQLLNDRPEVMAERVYAPWPDAEARLRERRIPLCSQESGLPLSGFDIVGFTLQYELSFATILAMLELGGIPVRAADRGDRDPLVVAGGPVAFAPEPLADFVDAFLIGDGEDAALELCAAVGRWKRHGGRRGDLLRAVKGIGGMYVPALHARGDVVRKRTALQLGSVDYGRLPVPYMEIVHDRASLEVMRGCAQGCRFCQAGYVYRPVRERQAAAIRDMVERTLSGSGYEEISLSSLSIADLSCLPGLFPALMRRLTPSRTSLSLPSLRVEALNRNPDLAAEIARVRKTGFTMAPEAGSERLRRVINKVGFDEQAILSAVQNAARAGWESVKCYFMIGLPTETPADLDDIVRVAREAASIARREKRRGFGLTVSASSFVPKPHTPFQWCAQEPMEVLQEKQRYLRGRLRELRIDFKWQHVESSFLEAVLARGGREVGAAIALAHERGCRFDGWTEQLKFDTWMRAFADAGVDAHAIANQPFPLDTSLPWDHIESGVDKTFLLREYRRALDEQATADCHAGPCNGCGEQCAPDWQQWAQDAAAFSPAPGRIPASAGGPSAEGAVEPPSAHAQQKIRFEFQKVGELRFLSHLELMRALQRALRRAGIPLAYTQGFNPQPRLSLAQALAVGVEGLQELGDIELTQRLAPEEMQAAWNRQLPPELKILRAWEAPLNGPSLSAGVRGAVYQIQLTPNGWDATLLTALGTREACAAFLAQESIPVEVTKKGKALALDARPFLEEFASTGDDAPPAWQMRLRVGPTGSVKPAAVMRSFLGGRVPPGDLDRMVSSLRIARTALALEGQG
ncbi:MAG: Radical domain protein [candidate division NC10 bacterium]|nr:Radical domain protein [candidate division NC10 bacterium]